jgi:hypothetical protein
MPRSNVAVCGAYEATQPVPAPAGFAARSNPHLPALEVNFDLESGCRGPRELTAKPQSSWGTQASP